MAEPTTAHELARRLLEGPDLPVVIAKGEMGDLEPVNTVEQINGRAWWDWDAPDMTRRDAAVELR